MPLTLQCETDLDSGADWEPQCKMAFVASQVSIWPAYAFCLTRGNDYRMDGLVPNSQISRYFI